MRVTTLHLGSDTFQLLIADMEDPRNPRILSREDLPIQIGKTSLMTEWLDRKTMKHGLECLDSLRRLAIAQCADRIYAAATGAISDAANGEEFIGRAGKRYGIAVHLLSPREEAETWRTAVSGAIEIGDEKTLFVNVGGSNVHLAVMSADQIHLAIRLKMGFLRLHGRFVTHDPVSKREERVMRAFLRESLAPLLLKLRRHQLAAIVTIGRTAESLLQITRPKRGAAGNASPPQADIRVSDIAACLDEMRQMESYKYAEEHNLNPPQAQYIFSALLFMNELGKGLKAKFYRACPVTLAAGLLREAASHWKPAEPEEALPTDRRLQQAMNFASQYRHPEVHSRQVCRLACQIFDQTARLHQLGESERKLLRYACILHDIGYHIEYANHHRHGWQLIQSGLLSGFTTKEKSTIAWMVRHHRRPVLEAPPPADSRALQAPDALKYLMSIFRIANALDRSHFSCISEVQCRSRGKRLRFVLIGDIRHPGMDLDMRTAERHAGDFEKLFGVETVFVKRKDT